MTRPGNAPVNQGLYAGIMQNVQQVWLGWFTNISGLFSSSNLTTTVAPTGSPFNYVNNASFIVMVIVTGGTVSGVSIGRKNAAGTYVDVTFATASPCHILMSSGDRLIVTYSAAPTLTVSPL